MINSLGPFVPLLGTWLFLREVNFLVRGCQIVLNKVLLVHFIFVEHQVLIAESVEGVVRQELSKSISLAQVGVEVSCFSVSDVA